MVKINKDKCIGCALCVSICPDGIKMVKGKAEIKDKNASCLKDAAKACPQGAISIGEEESNIENENPNFNPNYSRDRGTGLGRGMGLGRGLGRGPRDGRGQGRGGGGRRR